MYLQEINVHPNDKNEILYLRGFIKNCKPTQPINRTNEEESSK